VRGAAQDIFALDSAFVLIEGQPISPGTLGIMLSSGKCR
jgi:hypothetical protein